MKNWKGTSHISDDGWRVGLHGGNEAYNKPAEVTSKKRKLEKVLKKEVMGYRNHYLQFKTPKTWELLTDANFDYDPTFGHRYSVGFRNGMCHPFRPYNLNTGKDVDIIEIPLSIMDTTLFSQMHIDLNQAWKLTEKLIDTVERHRGVLTVLWHNTYMQGIIWNFSKKSSSISHKGRLDGIGSCNIQMWKNKY